VTNLPRLPGPGVHADEREAALAFLDHQRRSVMRKVEDLSEEQARWRPGGALISLLGITNHLAHVEWRWCEGAIKGGEVNRSEGEFEPGHDVTVDAVLTLYRDNAAATDAAIRAVPSLTQRVHRGEDMDVRWVLLHLLEETARHAGHADATRELLDGTTGL
jgi:uncharacterized damage-inducible protein DinB